MKRNSLASIVICLLFIGTLAVPGKAFAQDGPEGPEATGTGSVLVSLGYLTTTTAVLAGVALVAGLGITTVLAVRSQRAEEEALQTYLNQNGVAVQQDLYLGAGESLLDLAQIFGVQEAELPLFSEHLFLHRQELAGFLEAGDATWESTQSFAALVREGLNRYYVESSQEG